MKVEIKEPCHENWETMKIGLISRHCDVCQKDVTDFTQKSRADIIIHLLSNPSGSVCGRMNRSQFDFHHDDIPILIEALSHRPGNASFLVLTLVCLSLASCSADNKEIKPAKPNLPTEQTHTQKDSGDDNSNHKGAIVGEIEMPPSKKESCEKTIRTEQQLQGEVVTTGITMLEPIEPVIQGGMEVPIPSPEIVKFAEQMPEFEGGTTALFAFIRKNIRYPEKEQKAGIGGTVYAKVIIAKDGSVTNPTILRSIADHPAFDAEVLRVISLMPNWIPGKNKGENVAVEYTLPFRFKND